ncbi:VOC family protein [Erythrobacter sp. HA6-11]
MKRAAGLLGCAGILGLLFAIPQSVAQDTQSGQSETVATPETGGEVYSGATIRRWSPIVSDMDRAIELYRDILGFELARIYEDPPESYVFEIYGIAAGTKTRHAMFNAGDDMRVLSVVEVPDLERLRATEAPRMSALLVNANGRFDEIVAMLRDRDYRLLSPHKLGANGIEMGFVDYDGHLYALYEIPYSGEITFDD